jgi:hypothetical protein
MTNELVEKYGLYKYLDIYVKKISIHNYFYLN